MRRLLNLMPGDLRVQEALTALQTACQAATPAAPIVQGILVRQENGMVRLKADDLRVLGLIVTNVIPLISLATTFLSRALPGRVVVMGRLRLTGEEVVMYYQTLHKELQLASLVLAGWQLRAQNALNQEFVTDVPAFSRPGGIVAFVSNCMELTRRAVPFLTLPVMGPTIR